MYLISKYKCRKLYWNQNVIDLKLITITVYHPLAKYNAIVHIVYYLLLRNIMLYNIIKCTKAE